MNGPSLLVSCGIPGMIEIEIILTKIEIKIILFVCIETSTCKTCFFFGERFFSIRPKRHSLVWLDLECFSTKKVAGSLKISQDFGIT